MFEGPLNYEELLKAEEATYIANFRNLETKVSAHMPRMARREYKLRCCVVQKREHLKRIAVDPIRPVVDGPRSSGAATGSP